MQLVCRLAVSSDEGTATLCAHAQVHMPNMDSQLLLSGSLPVQHSTTALAPGRTDAAGVGGAAGASATLTPLPSPGKLHPADSSSAVALSGAWQTESMQHTWH